MKRALAFVLIMAAAVFMLPSGLSLAAPPYTTAQVTQMASNVVDQFESSGVFPTSISVPGTSDTITIENFFTLTAKCIQQINDDDTGSVALITANDAAPNQRIYRDVFNDSKLLNTYYLNTINRNLAYIAANNRFASYVIYPSASWIPCEGNFSFMRACFTYARALKHYNTHQVLPIYVDCTIPKEYDHPSLQPATSFEFSLVTYAFDQALNVYLANGSMPGTITINGYSIDKPSYVRLAFEAVMNANAQKTASPVPCYACAAPTGGAANTFSSKDISKSGYLNVAQRQLIFMNGNNNKPANVVGDPQGYDGQAYTGQFTYEKSMIVFARILSYYHHNGALPYLVHY